MSDAARLCVPPSSIGVRVDPAADASIAPRVEHELTTEFSSKSSPRCWKLPAGSEGPALTVEVRWLEGERARVLIVGRTRDRVHSGIRDLDLHGLPPDGIPLAITIAADELIETIGEQIAELRPEPKLVLPAPATTASAPPPPPPPPRRLSFGPSFAFDVVGSNIVLVGPDARLVVPLTTNIGLSLRLGERTSTNRSSVASAWIAGSALQVGPQVTRTGFALSAGLDTISMSLPTTTDVVTKTIVLGRVGLTTFFTLAPGLRLTADGYVGGPFASTHVTLDREPKPSFRGVAFGGAVGLSALF